MIFHVDPAELDWSDYTDDQGPVPIRYKALTAGTSGVPPVQYLEYGPGHTDSVHQHDVGEFFIVTRGDMWLGERRVGPEAVVFIPAHTDYALRAGDHGVQFFRVVSSPPTR